MLDWLDYCINTIIPTEKKIKKEEIIIMCHMQKF